VSNAHKTFLVTGGAGFIGGNFVRLLIRRGARAVNLDALTYAGNLGTLAPMLDHPNHLFVRGSIGDRVLVGELLSEHWPQLTSFGRSRE
jgi:dTDP-glucose 4,6-dehydratase